MLISSKPSIPSSQITGEAVYLKRRDFITKSVVATTGAFFGRYVGATDRDELVELNYQKAVQKGPAGFYTAEKLTPFSDASRYNNFYEFGTDKSDPARYAHELVTKPWSVSIDGEVDKPAQMHLEDILKRTELEERIYRLRCVEAWSMVIPWIGFPLSQLLKSVQPTSKAKYVQFFTVERPSQMRGQRSRTSTIDWPYVEGLRIDEAMHPLTLLAVGMYGKTLPNQNGAPIRLVVPWKYGFKSIKSIVRIRLSEQQPKTTWQTLAPSEYGFYANVNPDVDHPRWSQKSERRLPATFFSPNRVETQLFNGYVEQVASMYAGMDLRRYY